MANTTWNQIVENSADAYRTSMGITSKIKVGEIAQKISELDSIKNIPGTLGTLYLKSESGALPIYNIDILDTKLIEKYNFAGYADSNYPSRIAVDADGYVYSAGTDGTISKINLEGIEVWKVRVYTNEGEVDDIAVDSSGYVYNVVNYGFSKRTPAGAHVWKFAGHTSLVERLTVDSNGYVYSMGGEPSVRKVSPEGVEVWSFTQGITIYSVAVDNEGYVYIDNWGKIRKISPEGVLVWETTVFEQGHNNWIYGIAVDNEGYVYCGTEDYKIHTISPDGIVFWSFVRHTDRITSLAVDNNGYIYSSSWDKTLCKTSIQGKNIWSFTGHTGRVRDVGVDSNGYVYSCGDTTIRKISQKPSMIQVYLKDDYPKIVTWADGTDDEVKAMINAHHNGVINLHDYWSVGDKRIMSLSAMAAASTPDTHAAQDVEMTLWNAGGITLANNKECAFVVGQSEGLLETGYINSTNTNAGGFNGSMRYPWFDAVYYYAIPETIRDIYKPFKNITAIPNSDIPTETIEYFTYPAEKQIFGTNTYGNATAEASLSQFEWFVDTNNHGKHYGIGGTVFPWFTRTPYGGSYFASVARDGKPYYHYAPVKLLIVPFGCI